MSKNYEKDFNFININYYAENDEKFIPNKAVLNNNKIEKRKEIFRNILNKIDNNYHENFLKKEKINVQFDPLNKKHGIINLTPMSNVKTYLNLKYLQPPGVRQFLKKLSKKMI